MEIDVIHQVFSIATMPQRLEIKKQLQAIANSSFNDLEEPQHKVPLKGRRKGSRGKPKAQEARDDSTQRNPSAFEHAEANHAFETGPQSQQASSCIQPPPKKVKLTVKNVKKGKAPKKPNLLENLPSGWHKYITNIIDVPGDGNCGFRVVADFLGKGMDGWSDVRKELDAELCNNEKAWDQMLQPVSNFEELHKSLGCDKKNAPRDKWMIMPSSGDLIATTYQIPVVLISNAVTLTFFPLNQSFNGSKEHRILVFGYINNNHFIRLELSNDCPLPPVSGVWKEYHKPEAEGWELKFASRIDRWKAEFFTSVEHSSIIE